MNPLDASLRSMADRIAADIGTKTWEASAYATKYQTSTNYIRQALKILIDDGRFENVMRGKKRMFAAAVAKKPAVIVHRVVLPLTLSREMQASIERVRELRIHRSVG